MKIYKPSEYEITCDICGASIIKRVNIFPFIFGDWFFSGNYTEYNVYKYKSRTFNRERHLCYDCNRRMMDFIEESVKQKEKIEND